MVQKSEVRVHGAQAHNLKSIHVAFDPTAITVCCGLSGSGKTSFVRDVVLAEGRRQYLRALSGERERLTLPTPHVDWVTGLPPTLTSLQTEEDLPSREDVCRYSGLHERLAQLFGRLGVLHDPVTDEPLVVSTQDQIVAYVRSQPQSMRLAIEAPIAVGASPEQTLASLMRSGFSRVRTSMGVVRVEEARAQDVQAGLRVVIDRIKVSPDKIDRIHDAVRLALQTGHGIMCVVSEDREQTFADRPVSLALGRELPKLTPSLFISRHQDPCEACKGTGMRAEQPCGVCQGLGLGPLARHARFAGERWEEVYGDRVLSLAERLRSWPEDDVSRVLVTDLLRRCEAMIDLGLGALQLSRKLHELSSGELHRIRLADVLDVRWTGVLIVLDEPDTSLDDAGIDRLIAWMKQLKTRGNGLLLVTHHPRVLAVADHVIEFGPGPGIQGGQIVFEGMFDQLLKANTPTGHALRGLHPIPAFLQPVKPVRIGLGDADGSRTSGGEHDVVKGAVTVVTGPSASGKSRLLAQIADEVSRAQGPWQEAGLVRVMASDAQAAWRSRRSMVATYIGAWDSLREMLASTPDAKMRGLQAGVFSLYQRGGRCEHCQGMGVEVMDFGSFASAELPCEVCGGRRFTGDVLAVTYKGRNAAEWLALEVDEARVLTAGHPKLEDAWQALCDVGLGYLSLGQTTLSLSGGEARRLGLARELVRAARGGLQDTVVLLDEPAAGLHPADVSQIAWLCEALAARGASVVLATQNAQLLQASTHTIVLQT